MKNSIKLSFYVVLSVHTRAYAKISTDGTVVAIQHLSGQMTIPQSLAQPHEIIYSIVFKLLISIQVRVQRLQAVISFKT